jgi:hypothetical protein
MRFRTRSGFDLRPSLPVPAGRASSDEVAQARCAEGEIGRATCLIRSKNQSQRLWSKLGSEPNNQPATGKAVPNDIGGLSILKGLVLYGATITFAVLYIHFMVKIFQAPANRPPSFEGSLVSAAAALAGVLGSAFALDIGSPTDAGSTNPALNQALEQARTATQGKHWSAYVRRLLSLEPANVASASWPKTFGIWVYATVAGAVAITYVVNPHTTPAPVKALAISFGGYVIALITRAYGITTKG